MTGQHTLRDISDYYTNAWPLYRKVWCNGHNLAIHYGYWGAGVNSHADSLIAANRQLVEIAGIRPGMRILDAGCGVGGTTMWLAENYDVTVDGITITEDQAQIGRNIINQRRLSHRARILIGDYHNSGLPAASYDVVIAQESSVYSSDKVGFLREMARLLTDTGVIALADTFRAARPLPPDAERRLREWVRLWRAHDMMTTGEFIEFTRSAGFATADVVDVTNEVRPSSTRMKRLAIMNKVLNAPGRLIGFGDRSELTLANVAGALQQAESLRHGDWVYCIAVARKDGAP